MKIRIPTGVALSLIFLAMSVTSVAAQSLTKQITKTEKFDFGAGGTIVVTGAPKGSIKVTASKRNEVEIVAVTEVAAASQADLDKLAQISGFVIDETPMRTSVITVGPHNKFGLKKLPKGFPKGLEGMPISVDYTISVPRYSDLEIDGGVGDVSIQGIEGSMRVNLIESNAAIEIIGGTTTIMIGKGAADIAVGVKGWRGRSASVAMGSGDLTVRLPSTLSAELDATVLRTGTIENSLTDLKPRDRKIPFTDKSILAKAGVGGASVKFAVGDGKLVIKRLGSAD